MKLPQKILTSAAAFGVVAVGVPAEAAFARDTTIRDLTGAVRAGGRIFTDIKKAENQRLRDQQRYEQQLQREETRRLRDEQNYVVRATRDNNRLQTDLMDSNNDRAKIDDKAGKPRNDSTPQIVREAAGLNPARGGLTSRGSFSNNAQPSAQGGQECQDITATDGTRGIMCRAPNGAPIVYKLGN
ncbi:MAG: hypothetical protein DI551_07870 [Micavibrio aeruginosavorus]|uniref:Uncharacterized protein n=1 Tax=Micavibrio aeruginosavorus TaxID=349221 RepID=A0A2W5MWS3_9BACT|nr:MAG: hypothetical protein DI551_07870 [Micavibrio aeruginosavorus]